MIILVLVVKDSDKEVSTRWSGWCNKKWWAWLVEAQWDKPHPLSAAARVCRYMVFRELCTGVNYNVIDRKLIHLAISKDIHWDYHKLLL